MSVSVSDLTELINCDFLKLIKPIGALREVKHLNCFLSAVPTADCVDKWAHANFFISHSIFVNPTALFNGCHVMTPKQVLFADH